MFKNLFKTKHQHSWILVAKTYSEPIKPELLTQFDTISREVFQFLTGFTTLFFECACGEQKREELSGTENVTGNVYEETFAKVLTEGPQVLTTSTGIQFLVGKYVPSDLVPVR